MNKRTVVRLLFGGLVFAIHNRGFSVLAQPCQTRIAPIWDSHSYSGSDLALVSGYAEACKIEKIEFTDPDCHAAVSFEHGSTYFTCHKEEGFTPDRWRWTTGQFYGDAISVIGPSRKVSIPEHSKARRTWLAPIDQEGLLYAGYPVEMDVVNKYYPKKILASNTKKLEIATFPVHTQIVTYRNMRGDVRSAVAGRVTFGCNAELSIYRWSKPKQATALRNELEKKLVGVKLVPITDRDVQWIKNACKQPPDRQTAPESDKARG